MAALPFVLWLVVVVALGVSRPEGDVLLPAGSGAQPWVTYGMLLAGTLAGGVTVATQISGTATGRPGGRIRRHVSSVNGARFASPSASWTAEIAAAAGRSRRARYREPGQLALQVGHRDVADEQRQAATRPGGTALRNCCDGRVLDAGVDEPGVAAHRRRPTRRRPTRPPIGPPNRVPSSSPHTPAPTPAWLGRDVGRLADVGRAVRVAAMMHRVVHLDLVVLLQSGDGEQELLRAQPVVEGDDEQLCCCSGGGLGVA